MSGSSMKKVRELVSNKRFWKEALLFPGCLFSLTTFALTFLGEVWFVQKHKLLLFAIILIVSFLSIVFFLLCKLRVRSVTVTINNSVLEVLVGDIFKQSDHEYKVISFNEFFDTLVDGKVVSRHSLNGQYLLQKYPGEKSIKRLNDRMAANEKLAGNIVDSQKVRKGGGKHTRYRLGSVFKDKDYFLVAFSMVNEQHEAGLTLTEYVHCLLKFWEEVECYRQGQTVVVTLLGTGITRYKNFIATHQELLEILIWTFKISKVHYKTPAKVKVVIHERQQKQINFYRLKELEKESGYV